MCLVENSRGGLGLPTGGVAELKNLMVQQGRDLDTKHMKANGAEETNSKHRWKFTITFKIASGQYQPLISVSHGMTNG